MFLLQYMRKGDFKNILHLTYFYNPVFDSLRREKALEMAYLRCFQGFLMFFDCTLRYLFFCHRTNIFHLFCWHDLFGCTETECIMKCIG